MVDGCRHVEVEGPFLHPSGELEIVDADASDEGAEGSRCSGAATSAMVPVVGGDSFGKYSPAQLWFGRRKPQTSAGKVFAEIQKTSTK